MAKQVLENPILSNCLRKYYPNEIIVTATTGKAAGNINGITLHSLV